ncbi:hypothetical protein TIFTF001_045519 [Ficus carica]|uniref:Uncharacterized protein n=1 Tax=Ficus carica TaxID=3494 RepID=A0AA88CLS4_FICCA|nr:hypothetical protein TIFTF001_045516 [Ficus carica]GMN21536.1 hypothetical protein TIFTF001_045519 [Ficus carica]
MYKATMDDILQYVKDIHSKVSSQPQSEQQMEYERYSMQEQNNEDNEDRICSAENDEDKSPKENEKDLANKGT